MADLLHQVDIANLLGVSTTSRPACRLSLLIRRVDVRVPRLTPYRIRT